MTFGPFYLFSSLFMLLPRLSHARSSSCCLYSHVHAHISTTCQCSLTALYSATYSFFSIFHRVLRNYIVVMVTHLPPVLHYDYTWWAVYLCAISKHNYFIIFNIFTVLFLLLVSLLLGRSQVSYCLISYLGYSCKSAWISYFISAYSFFFLVTTTFLYLVFLSFSVVVSFLFM